MSKNESVETKDVRISEKSHKCLSNLALKRDRKIGELADELLRRALKQADRELWEAWGLGEEE